MDKKKLLVATVVAFLVLAILYFLPIRIPFDQVFPMALLFVAGFALQSWPLIVAALFSAIGDYFGMVNQLLPQMGSFAVAQCCFIGYFLSRAWKKKQAGEKQAGGLWFAVVTLLAVALYYWASEHIFPCAPEGVIRTGMSVYAGLLVVMMWSALMQRDWMWGIGALLFVFSDGLIAHLRSDTRVPHAGKWIMVTYFLAQLLIFVRAALDKHGRRRLSAS